MKIRGNIFDIQHFSLNDGPGIRTVVFFKGCPLNCAWCHNPESKSEECELLFSRDKCVLCRKCMEVCRQKVHDFKNGLHNVNRSRCILCKRCAEACPTSALDITGKIYTTEEVMTEVEKDDIFFGDDGGITFSGGEPFMQFGFLYELLKVCREKNYSVCIETSGFTSADKLIAASEYTDLFLYDCKETNCEMHKKYTGVYNDKIMENLEALDRINASVVLRCPIIPKVNDRQEHFEELAKLSDKYSCIKAVEFMPYHPLGTKKCLQLGKECLFGEKEFMDKEKIRKYISGNKNVFNVPIKIN